MSTAGQGVCTARMQGCVHCRIHSKVINYNIMIMKCVTTEAVQNEYSRTMVLNGCWQSPSGMWDIDIHSSKEQVRLWV